MSADLSNLARHLMSQTPEGPSAAHDLPHLLTAKTAAAEEQFALAAVEFYSQQKLGRAGSFNRKSHEHLSRNMGESHEDFHRTMDDAKPESAKKLEKQRSDEHWQGVNFERTPLAVENLKAQFKSIIAKSDDPEKIPQNRSEAQTKYREKKAGAVGAGIGGAAGHLGGALVVTKPGTGNAARHALQHVLGAAGAAAGAGKGRRIGAALGSVGGAAAGRQAAYELHDAGYTGTALGAFFGGAGTGAALGAKAQEKLRDIKARKEDAQKTAMFFDLDIAGQHTVVDLPPAAAMQLKAKGIGVERSTQMQAREFHRHGMQDVGMSMPKMAELSAKDKETRENLRKLLSGYRERSKEADWKRTAVGAAGTVLGTVPGAVLGTLPMSSNPHPSLSGKSRQWYNDNPVTWRDYATVGGGIAAGGLAGGAGATKLYDVLKSRKERSKEAMFYDLDIGGEHTVVDLPPPAAMKLKALGIGVERTTPMAAREFHRHGMQDVGMHAPKMAFVKAALFGFGKKKPKRSGGMQNLGPERRERWGLTSDPGTHEANLKKTGIAPQEFDHLVKHYGMGREFAEDMLDDHAFGGFDKDSFHHNVAYMSHMQQQGGGPGRAWDAKKWGKPHPEDEHSKTAMMGMGGHMGAHGTAVTNHQTMMREHQALATQGRSLMDRLRNRKKQDSDKTAEPDPFLGVAGLSAGASDPANGMTDLITRGQELPEPDPSTKAELTRKLHEKMQNKEAFPAVGAGAGALLGTAIYGGGGALGGAALGHMTGKDQEEKARFARKGALIGGGAGTLIGAPSGAFIGNHIREMYEKKAMSDVARAGLRGAARGGAVGGTLLGGAGLAGSIYKNRQLALAAGIGGKPADLPLLGGTKAHYTAGIGAGLGALIEGSRAALKERKKMQNKEAGSLGAGAGAMAGQIAGQWGSVAPSALRTFRHKDWQKATAGQRVATTLSDPDLPSSGTFRALGHGGAVAGAALGAGKGRRTGAGLGALAGSLTGSRALTGLGAATGADIQERLRARRAQPQQVQPQQVKAAFMLQNAANVGLKGGGTVAGGLYARKKAKDLGEVPDAPAGASKKERFLTKMRQSASEHPNLAALGGAAGGYTAGAGGMRTLNYLAGE
jgi:hypothetical protein